jgi:hypothetical protein
MEYSGFLPAAKTLNCHQNFTQFLILSYLPQKNTNHFASIGKNRVKTSSLSSVFAAAHRLSVRRRSSAFAYFAWFAVKSPHSAFRTPNYIFGTPPISFAPAQKQTVQYVVQVVFYQQYAYQNPFFSTPPYFTPSAEKHFGPKPGRIGP